MYTAKEIEEKIKVIDQQLSEAIQSTSVDGTSHSVNLAEMRMERDRLMRMWNSTTRRPVIANINIVGG